MSVRTSSVVATGMIALAVIGLVTIFGGTIAAVVSPPAEPAGSKPGTTTGTTTGPAPAASPPSAASGPTPSAAMPAANAPAGDPTQPMIPTSAPANTQSHADKGR